MPEEEKIFEENYSNKNLRDSHWRALGFTQVFWNHSKLEVECCCKGMVMWKNGKRMRGEKRRGEDHVLPHAPTHII